MLAPVKLAVANLDGFVKVLHWPFYDFINLPLLSGTAAPGAREKMSPRAEHGQKTIPAGSPHNPADSSIIF